MQFVRKGRATTDWVASIASKRHTTDNRHQVTLYTCTLSSIRFDTSAVYQGILSQDPQDFLRTATRCACLDEPYVLTYWLKKLSGPTNRQLSDKSTWICLHQEPGPATESSFNHFQIPTHAHHSPQVNVLVSRAQCCAASHATQKANHLGSKWIIFIKHDIIYVQRLDSPLQH